MSMAVYFLSKEPHDAFMRWVKMLDDHESHCAFDGYVREK